MRKDKIDTFDIEHKGIGVFSTIFTSSIKVEQKPDMEHIDYRITIRENNEPTGEMYAVQLKSQEKASISDGVLKFPNFEVKHLKYYLEKLSYPVFIFVVDLSNSKCYWQFTQKWLKEEINNKNWINQKTTTIYIPIENEITSEKEFSSVARSAIEYMKNMHPGSLRSAYQNELEKLHNIDPRFDMDTYFTKNSFQHILKPNTKIDFKLTTHNAISKKKLSNFAKTGNQVQFSSNEVDFTDFPIYQHLKGKSSNLQVIISKRKLKSELHFHYNYMNTDYSLIIPGFSCGGSEQITFKGSLIDKLLTITFNLTFINNRISISNIEPHFELSSYENKTILNLPYFFELFALLNCMNNNQKIRARFLTNGLEIFSSEFVESKRNLRILHTVNLLYKSIEISKFFNINPVLTSYKELFNNSVEISILFDLIKSGKSEIVSKNKTINLSLQLNDTVKASDIMVPNKAYDFMLVSEESIKSILGYKVNAGKLVYSYINWVLATVIKSQDTSKLTNLELKANESSKIIVSRIS